MGRKRLQRLRNTPVFKVAELMNKIKILKAGQPHTDLRNGKY